MFVTLLMLERYSEYTIGHGLYFSKFKVTLTYL